MRLPPRPPRADARAAVDLPGRPAGAEVAVIAQVLVGHLATVVTLMEAEAAPPEIPPGGGPA
ncbi:MAG: hypothetical protein R3F43_01545 [bacterium]